MIGLFYENRARRSIMLSMVISYIILFFLIIVAAVMTIFLADRFMDNIKKDVIDQLGVISDQFENVGLEEFSEVVLITPDSFIEVLDENFTVTAQYNSPHAVGFKYTKHQIYSMAFNDLQELMSYNFYYRAENGDILLYVISEFSDNKLLERILYFAVTVFCLGLVVIILVYANLISRRFLIPLNKIREGVSRITRGEYDFVVDFRSANELGELRDAVNSMAMIIKEEILKRERAEIARKRLILDISHDLKTPLTNILGFSETLKTSKNLSQEEIDRYLEILLVNGRKANRMINDLFDLARMEDVDYQFPKDRNDLAEILRLLMADAIPQFESLGIEYSFNLPEEPVWSLVNPQYINRALDNIINNFLKYSGSGARFHCSLTVINNDALIVLEDNGPGIPKDHHDRIFMPFYRIDPSRNPNTGGTGLGLAISRFIIRKHGGDITLDREAEVGSRFLIYLPTILRIEQV